MTDRYHSRAELLAAFFLGALLGPSPAGADTLLQLEPCRISDVDGLTSTAARCGTLSVPEDPEDAGGPRIQLAIAVVPAVATRAKPDPLVLIAGGPGQGAIQTYAPLLPMFAGVQPEAAVRQVLDEFLSLAVQHGVAGRVEVGNAGAGEAEQGGEQQLPPLHQEAYDAIERGDLEGAAAAYTQALKENPGDSDAELELAQVALLQRTQGVDLQTARQAAADNPEDVAAQSLVADLDVLGGHVEDAFGRMIDLVRVTSGDEREQARAHLLGLFAVVGGHDERVRKARTALMSALF